MLAERRQRIGYKRLLEAAVGACRHPHIKKKKIEARIRFRKNGGFQAQSWRVGALC